jgi:hypothetical protein
MTLFVVDIEADGPYPGDYSMVSMGIVPVKEDMSTVKGFLGEFKPISDLWIPDALAVSGHSRETCLAFPDPAETVKAAIEFVEANSNGHCVFLSDNNGFDWQFTNYYFHKYGGRNPFGFSSRRIGDFYAGLEKNWKAANNWKRHRTTKHDHNPLNDAMGNAEAFIWLMKKHGIQIPQ